MTELYRRVASIQEQLLHPGGTSNSCLESDAVNDLTAEMATTCFIQNALLAVRRSELQPGGIQHEVKW